MHSSSQVRLGGSFYGSQITSIRASRAYHQMEIECKICEYTSFRLWSRYDTLIGVCTTGTQTGSIVVISTWPPTAHPLPHSQRWSPLLFSRRSRISRWIDSDLLENRSFFDIFAFRTSIDSLGHLVNGLEV